ncbi:Membrane associated serine protease, rhomboid family [Cognatiyoonia koreensis]|uniref:Membrane associated serine protease, rhomboid family n=1 Tax=Cognatiyoonia koreensis TaxID=364200 RepID=A0A1I0QFB4_9RHOB|nr:rhomboid family intramembrane serine protease [Cognatiyoonia koreensis]SEW25711.1 Membrane associated serine protease, rhomboid family [Cognatiyoonia koreensis]
MLPIRDHNPSETVPYVTYVLIALNVGIFLFMSVLATSEQALGYIYYHFGMIPVRISMGEGYSGLVTAIFLHGGFMHLAGNMLFLWIFGDNLEDKMGPVVFALFYMVCGVGANIAQFALEPGSPVPTVGASGAIAGVMGGYILLFPKAKVDIFIYFVVFFRILPLPAWIMLGVWFGLQLFNTINGTEAGIAYMAHAAGFVIGALLTLPTFRRLGGQRFWRNTDYHPDHPAADYSRLRSRIPVVRRR